MLIKYNIDKNPLIFVEFLNEKDINNDSYYKFMEFWVERYQQNNNFKFIMNLSKLTRPNLFLINDFMNQIFYLKNNYKVQYLDFSILILVNPLIRNILDYLWKNTCILNTIYLVKDESQAKNLLNILENNIYSKEFIKSYCLCNKIIIKEP